MRNYKLQFEVVTVV